MNPVPAAASPAVAAPPHRADAGGLEALVREACRTVPYYRSRTPDFASLPVVSKEAMRAHPEEFLSVEAQCDRKALVEVLRRPPGPGDAEFRFGPHVVVEQTSGSSGLPFLIPKTREERVRVSIGIWRARRDIDPEASVRNFMAMIHRGRETAPLPSLPALLRRAGRLGIRWLHLNPRILELCLALQAEGRAALPSSLRFVESSGSALDPGLREKMKATEVAVVDQYGCREVWAIGYARPGGGFAVVESNVRVELLDDQDRPVRGDGMAGRVVVTALHQRLFPFIRYDTGDLARFRPEAGKMMIELLPYRPCHVVLGLPGRPCGTEVFKLAMVGVYRRLGYIPLGYLQIRQLGNAEFSIVMERTSRGESIRSLVEDHFNRVTGLQPRARFLLTELERAELPDDSKPCLFTNRYFRTLPS